MLGFLRTFAAHASCLFIGFELCHAGLFPPWASLMLVWNADTFFYGQPRFVTHIDDGAIAALTKCAVCVYGKFMQQAWLHGLCRFLACVLNQQSCTTRHSSHYLTEAALLQIL